jgi:hypothetical protein
VAEFGTTAVVSVSLNSQPLADVTIAITRDSTEASVSSTTLTFTAETWQTAVALTVTGVQETEEDETTTTALLTSASSADSYYEGLTGPAVSVVCFDGNLFLFFFFFCF